MRNPKDVLAEFVTKSRRRQEKEAYKHEAWRQAWKTQSAEAEQVLFPHLRPAARSDYERWLTKFLAAGVTPTHYYDYPWGGVSNRGGEWLPHWYVAESDFRMLPLCGSAAVQIIVPEGVRCLGGDAGHCNLFFEAGPEPWWVPVYSDLEVGDA